MASSRLRGIRRASQTLFLLAFAILFGLAAYLVTTPVPPDLFLRADPLIALSAMASLRRLIFPLLWFALPVIALSLALGRVFCGWVCPMGTAIDVCERVFGLRGRRPAQALPWRRLKFYLLIALLVTIILPAAHRSAQEIALSQTVGLSAVYLLDPIALLTRVFTLAFLPVVQWVTRLTGDVVISWTYSDFVDRHMWVGQVLGPVQVAVDTVSRPVSFRLGAATLAFFAGVIALGRFARRFWCRNLCPLGALLGLLGKASPLRLSVSDRCTRCLRCVNECKMGAITDDPHSYQGAECIQCAACIAVCPERAISFTAGLADTGRVEELQLDRRRLLQAAGLGIAAVALPKADWATARGEAAQFKLSGSKLIRPPGALREDPFVTACVRCGECMKVCPTNTLQPALGEGGLEALATPIVVPRIGPCAEACDLCGQVCPTRAIEPFAAEEKSHLYLGTAVVDRSMCVAWANEQQCLVCDEQCSYNAISQKVVDGLGRPIVDERICVGCGVCEYVCPVRPQRAIHVYASGDRRDWGRERQREWREGAQQEGGTESPYPGL